MKVVLIVDDNSDYLELLRFLLDEELGELVECACAQSVSQAHQLLADPSYEGRIAAAIVDLRIEGGDVEGLIHALPPGTPYWRFSSFAPSEVDCYLLGSGFYPKSQLEELAQSVASELSKK